MLDWNNPPQFGRTYEILDTLKLLQQVKPEGAVIVETGCLRGDALMSGDGWSTLAWGWFCHETGGHAYTVDHTPLHLDVCRRLTAPYASCIECHLGDSVEYLRNWVTGNRGPIHLMYHDSFDYTDGQKDASANHHLVEARTIYPALAPQCLVSFDDCNADGDGWIGKGEKAIPWYLEQGFKVEWSRGVWHAGGQVLLSRGI